MREAVGRGGGVAGLRRPHHEPARDRGLEGGEHVVRGRGADAEQRADVDVLAQQGGGDDHLAGVGVERAEGAGDVAADVGRLRDTAPQVGAGRPVVAGQLGGHGLHEQRPATGALVDGAGELGVVLDVLGRQALGDALDVQRLHGDGHDAALAADVGERVGDRAGAPGAVAVGDEDEQAGRRHLAAQAAQDAEGGVVGGVEVLEDDEPAAGLGRGEQGAGDGVHQPEPRGRGLGRLGRRLGEGGLDVRGLAAGRREQAEEGPQRRGALVVQAAAPRDAHPGAGRLAAGLHGEPRLADAGRTGEDDEPAGPVARAGEELTEQRHLGLPPDEGAQRGHGFSIATEARTFPEVAGLGGIGVHGGRRLSARRTCPCEVQWRGSVVALRCPALPRPRLVPPHRSPTDHRLGRIR